MNMIKGLEMTQQLRELTGCLRKPCYPGSVTPVSRNLMITGLFVFFFLFLGEGGGC